MGKRIIKTVTKEKAGKETKTIVTRKLVDDKKPEPIVEEVDSFVSDEPMMGGTPPEDDEDTGEE